MVQNSVVALIPAIILCQNVVILDCTRHLRRKPSSEIMEIMGASVKRYDDV